MPHKHFTEYDFVFDNNADRKQVQENEPNLQQMILQKERELNRKVTPTERSEIKSLFEEIEKERTKPSEEQPIGFYEWGPEQAEVLGGRVPLDRLGQWVQVLMTEDDKTESFKNKEAFDFVMQQIQSHMKKANEKGEDFKKWYNKYLWLVDKDLQEIIKIKRVNLEELFLNLNKN